MQSCNSYLEQNKTNLHLNFLLFYDDCKKKAIAYSAESNMKIILNTTC